jgi:hypothetical protein
MQRRSCPPICSSAAASSLLQLPRETPRPAVWALPLIEAMGIDPSRTGVQLELSSPMITSPSLCRIEQSLSYPAGAAVRRYGKVLDPGTLPEPYRNELQIDGRESNECLVLVRDEDGRSIVGNSRLDPISRDCRRPVSRACPRSGEEPVVRSRDRKPFARSCLPDHGALSRAARAIARGVRRRRRHSPTRSMSARSVYIARSAR